mgnify:CR=1 FL=1
MSISAECASLRKKISAHMPLLDQRARSRELASVVREAVTRGDATPAGFLRLYTEYAERLAKRMLRLDALRAAYTLTKTDEQRTAVIAAFSGGALAGSPGTVKKRHFWVPVSRS